MGRVYEALIKADRWKEKEAGIGRPPAPNSSETERHVSPAAENAAANQSPSAPPAWEQPAAGFPADFDPLSGEAIADSFEIADHASQSGSPAQPQVQVVTPERVLSLVSPSPPAYQEFEEPRQIAHALNLSADPQLAAIAGGDQLALERYRTLAVRLQQLAEARGSKTLLVTSAVENEGKSTVALNLGWLLAKHPERRVLLIEANLHRLSISRMLGIKPRRSWLEVLAGRSRLADAAVRLDPNGLYLLMHRSTLAVAPPGAVADPSSAFSATSFRRLLADLEQNFDLIIIDAPAILQFAEVRQLTSIADGTMLVVRAGTTRRDAVARALDLISDDRRLGVVLNETEVDRELDRVKQTQRARSRSYFGRSKFKH